jgi:hypothetical protein
MEKYRKEENVRSVDVRYVAHEKVIWTSRERWKLLGRSIIQKVIWTSRERWKLLGRSIIQRVIWTKE